MDSTGDLIARVHTGAWRAPGQLLSLNDAELRILLPTLFQSASAGLVWWRIRDLVDPGSALGQALSAAYQAQIEANEALIGAIQRAVAKLRAVGIEPVLVKGWAVSRRYSPPAVRLCGDIDLIVAASDYETARSEIVAPGSDPIGAAVDLQTDPQWMGRGDPDLFATSETVMLGNVPVRTPSDEAHLRLLCLHLLVHGAMRPLWLCDVALLLENRSPDFDWEQCLGCDRLRRRWVLTVLRLAHDVLGADITGTPVETELPELPGWLVPALLGRWAQAAVMPAPVNRKIVFHPNRLVPAMRERWQDPIRATVTCGVPFNSFPRLPIQLAAFALRSGQFLVTRSVRDVH